MINNFVRSQNAICLALHDYDIHQVDYKGLTHMMIEYIRSCGLEPNASGVSAPDIKSIKIITLKGGINRLEKREYKNIESIGIYAIKDGLIDNCQYQL